MRVRQDLTKITISHPNSHFPARLRGACVEILEAKLGDVVSGDLCCLVNKLCEAATSSYLHQTLAISDYGYVLSKGRVLMEGKPSELGKTKEVHQAYFG